MSTETSGSDNGNPTTNTVTLSASRKALFHAARSAWNLAQQIDPTVESLPREILVDMCKQFRPSIPSADGAIEELWNHGLIDKSTKGSNKTWSLKADAVAQIKTSGTPRKNLGQKTVAAILKRHTGLEATNGAAKTASVPAPPAPRPEIVLSAKMAALFGTFQRAWKSLKEQGFDGPGVPSSITIVLSALFFPKTLTSGMSQYAGKLRNKGALERHGTKTKALWLPLDVTVHIGRGKSDNPTVEDAFIHNLVEVFLKTEPAPEPAAEPPKNETLRLNPTELTIFNTFKMAWELLQQVDSPFHGVPSSVTNAINERYKPDNKNSSLITTQIARTGGILEKIGMGNVAHWKPTDQPILEKAGVPRVFDQLTRSELIELMADTLPQVSDALRKLLGEIPKKSATNLPVAKLSPSKIVIFRTFQRAHHVLKMIGENAIPSEVTNRLVRILLPERKNAPQVTNAIAKTGALAKIIKDEKNFWVPQVVAIVRSNGPKDVPPNLTDEQIIEVLSESFPDIREALAASVQAESETQTAEPAEMTPPQPQEEETSEKTDVIQPADPYALIQHMVPNENYPPIEAYIMAILGDLSLKQTEKLVNKLTVMSAEDLHALAQKHTSLKEQIEQLQAELEESRKLYDQASSELGDSQMEAERTALSIILAAKARKTADKELDNLF